MQKESNLKKVVFVVIELLVGMIGLCCLVIKNPITNLPIDFLGEQV